ncbi:glycine--tRNA ligase subunit beta [Jeotgalibaca sp. A127]|uniref:glycine--tRNA ligase subunit beta n=1 Tax=Jeotgalibaca sp. A127 TaxID=3457324 RepID=UPI003FD3B5A5
MTETLLVEIGLEEVPARFVRSSSEQLQERLTRFLKENRIKFGEVQVFATPRRLAVQIKDVAEKQEDIIENAKGPAKKIALDADGNWTKAAQGFARGQGVSTEDLYFESIKDVEYVYAKKEITGIAVAEVLKAIPEVVGAMNFPVSMHWGKTTFEFIRPVHWFVVMFGSDVVPCSFLGVKADNISRGHRFLGQDAIIDHADNYAEKLQEQFVIANLEERKEMIQKQFVVLEQENGWIIPEDDTLMEEVVSLVEYPTAFAGDFDERYLELPEEVLITSMKGHQRYFEVTDQTGKLLPYFIGVRNGDANHIENVKKGNRKVLTARLEDALFFYEEDKKMAIASAVDKLASVSFHAKIGSLAQKMANTAQLSQIIAEMVGLDEEQKEMLQRAANIYKFDLVSNMVSEFPELQGAMGEKYALMAGEKPEVAVAIREHYLPLSSDGAVPQSLIGSILAISDKFDSVISFFKQGMIPTGSNDPYALRRQTMGIVQIIEANGWSFSFGEVLDNALRSIYGLSDGAQITNLKEEIVAFTKSRVLQKLQAYGISHDIQDAILHANNDDIMMTVKQAQTLSEHQSDADYKDVIEALARVVNISQKVMPPYEVKVELLETSSEKNLYTQGNHLATVWDSATVEEAYQALRDLVPYITAYFDENMVMVEDISLRENRLNTLAYVGQYILQMADVRKLITK